MNKKLIGLTLAASIMFQGCAFLSKHTGLDQIKATLAANNQGRLIVDGKFIEPKESGFSPYMLTGKGSNLAINDVKVLKEGLDTNVATTSYEEIRTILGNNHLMIFTDGILTISERYDWETIKKTYPNTPDLMTYNPRVRSLHEPISKKQWEKLTEKNEVNGDYKFPENLVGHYVSKDLDIIIKENSVSFGFSDSTISADLLNTEKSWGAKQTFWAASVDLERGYIFGITFRPPTSKELEERSIKLAELEKEWDESLKGLTGLPKQERMDEIKIARKNFNNSFKPQSEPKLSALFFKEVNGKKQFSLNHQGKMFFSYENANEILDPFYDQYLYFDKYEKKQ